jgi:hypothetical protein
MLEELPVRTFLVIGELLSEVRELHFRIAENRALIRLLGRAMRRCASSYACVALWLSLIAVFVGLAGRPLRYFRCETALYAGAVR